MLSIWNRSWIKKIVEKKKHEKNDVVDWITQRKINIEKNHQQINKKRLNAKMNLNYEKKIFILNHENV